MNWFNDLFFGSGIAHSIFVLALAIGCGIFLSEKLKIKGITLGITWILFCAIACSHFGMHLDPAVESFAKDFGLILFVYSIGLQVGPSFFSSFSKGGLKLNLFAAAIVLLGCVTAWLIHWLSGEEMATMTGVLFGAVTNTPGLGAAEQAYQDVVGLVNPNIASGYAMAYPLGVVGILVSLMLLKVIFGIKLDKEEERVRAEKGEEKQVMHYDLELTNPQVEGIRVRDLSLLTHVTLLVSRLLDTKGNEFMPDADTVLHVGDKVRIVTESVNEKTVMLLGKSIEIAWEEKEKNVHLVNRHIVVTKPKMNGKKISDLKVREAFNITITRVRRETAFAFFGIVLGVSLGALPIMLPGLSHPFKLGIAGGALIVAILIGAFGTRYHLVTYTTTSANLMIREIGIALFLGAVGFGAGKTFIPTLIDGGYVWIGYGVIITLLPLLLIGFAARKWGKLDYFTLMGLIAGSTTDPPALSYATAQSSVNDRAAVAYSTVYPFTMFLRVLTGQLLIVLFL